MSYKACLRIKWKIRAELNFFNFKNYLFILDCFKDKRNFLAKRASSLTSADKTVTSAGVY